MRRAGIEDRPIGPEICLLILGFDAVDRRLADEVRRGPIDDVLHPLDCALQLRRQSVDRLGLALPLVLRIGAALVQLSDPGAQQCDAGPK